MREIRDHDTIYTEVDPRDLFAHLQAGCPAGVLLGVLEHINILGDALNLQMIAMHRIVHRKEVKGVPDSAPCLEVSK